MDDRLSCSALSRWQLCCRRTSRKKKAGRNSDLPATTRFPDLPLTVAATLVIVALPIGILAIGLAGFPIRTLPLAGSLLFPIGILLLSVGVVVTAGLLWILSGFRWGFHGYSLH